jgi:hypothetical protein
VILSNWNSEAVLDRETGLVWDRAPDAVARDWFRAARDCLNLSKGGRRGWRLPTAAELASLVDPTVTAAPVLPAGHPFVNVQTDLTSPATINYYWSSTTRA